jgi:hypothetical protein
MELSLAALRYRDREQPRPRAGAPSNRPGLRSAAEIERPLADRKDSD